MRVCFFTYPAAFQNVGGGEIQLQKTREYLQKRGIAIDLFDPWSTKIEDYDILHVFSSVKDCLGLINVAASRGVKIVNSPVFWSDLTRAFAEAGGPRVKAEHVMRHITKVVLPNFPSGRRKIMLRADAILPNSQMEKNQIVRLFKIHSSKIHVVTNGVEDRFASADPGLFKEKFGNYPFVLSVGRIEPRKNQLNLIRAIKKVTNARLVFIGDPVAGYEAYYKRCREEASTLIQFLPGMGHHNPLLASAYAACEVFVLQGFFETPGLVALEAALAGAKICATKGGSTREYFLQHANYFDPSSISDMAKSVKLTLDKSPSEALKKHVMSHHTWPICAQQTLAVYQQVLSKS